MAYSSRALSTESDWLDIGVSPPEFNLQARCAEGLLSPREDSSLRKNMTRRYAEVVRTPTSRRGPPPTRLRWPTSSSSQAAACSAVNQSGAPSRIISSIDSNTTFFPVWRASRRCARLFARSRDRCRVNSSIAADIKHLPNGLNTLPHVSRSSYGFKGRKIMAMYTASTARRLRALAPVLGLVLMGACVATGSRSLDDRTAIISGAGGAMATAAQVQQHIFVAAAKSTLAHGYTKFVILGSQDTSSTSQYTAPSTSSTSGTFHAQPTYGGVSGTYSQDSVYHPGQTYSFFKPGMDVTIRMFTDGDAPNDAWVAQKILDAQPKRKH